MIPCLLMSLAIAAAEEPTAPPPPPAPPAPAPPPAEPPSETITGNAEQAGASALAGVHVGPSIGVLGTGVGVLPRLEVGVLAPGSSGFFAFATASWTRPVTRGTVEDPRVPGGAYAWTAAHSELAFGVGGAIRFGRPNTTVRPEVALAPHLWVWSTAADGDADGAAFGRTTERAVVLGAVLSGGASAAVGPGHVVARVEVASLPLAGRITGRGAAVNVAPTVGYRMSF